MAGHSSGGYVGTALAEQRPDLVRSLALIGTGPSIDALLPQPIILKILLGPTPSVWASEVDVAVPRASRRLPGISMAGFRQRVPVLWDIAMVVHPSVTLLVDLSEGEGPVYDIDGRDQRGSVVVGLLPGDLRAAFTGLTPTAVATAPWLAIDDVAWPASSPTRKP